MANTKALSRVPIDRLEKRLESEPTDDQEQLIELARNTTNGHAAGVALVVAVLRSAERGEPIDPRVDGLIQWKKLVQESWDLVAPWDGLDEAIAAVKALGANRGSKVVAGLLQRDPSFPFGCLFLHLFPRETGLLEQAVGRLLDWMYPSGEVAMGLSLFSPGELTWVVEQFPRFEAGGRGLQIAKLGVQASLMRAAQRGETWDPNLDALLDVHSLWPESEFLFVHHASSVLRAALAALPLERAMAWFEAQVTQPLPSTFTRLLLVAPRAHDALLDRLLTLLTQNAKSVRKPAFDWVTDLARELGPRAAAHLPAVPKGKLRKSFEAGMQDLEEQPAPAPPPEPKVQTKAKTARVAKMSAAVQRVERLAEAARNDRPTVNIFALESVAKPEPKAISRVGGSGFDLGERHPSFEDLPMTHVFTVALDDVPELQSVFPNAQAFALYISEPWGNEASDPETAETAVIGLTSEDLARGPAPAGDQDLPVKGIRVSRIEVPESTFGRPTPHAKILRAVASLPARAGGQPFWLQAQVELEQFVMQFDERFAPINLGDGGVMYVFGDGAFWQSR